MRLNILSLTLFALLASAPAFAQNDATQAIIDSLQNVVETTDQDTTKARSLCELCWELRIAGQLEAALENGEAGLKLAREIGDRKGAAKCLSMIGLVSYSQGDFARALDYQEKSLKIREEIGDRDGEASLLGNIGAIYSVQNEYERALDYFQRSMKIFDEIGDRQGKASGLNQIGNIYVKQGNYARALEGYLKSLKIKEEIGDRKGEASSLNNIGLVYHRQGDFVRALEFYQRSLKINKETGDRTGEAQSQSNMGSIYMYQGDYANARAYFRKSLNNFEEIGDRYHMAGALLNIGNTYAIQSDNARALDYYEQSLKIRREIGDLNGAALSMSNIAELKILLNKPAEGRSLADDALDIATKIGALGLMISAAKARAKADSALGDWKSAYEHFKLHKQYSDSMYSESQAKEIGRLESKYEFDKKIEARERAAAEEAERRQMLYWIAAGVFAALLAVAGLLVWGFQTKKKANKQLALQNAEIRQQSEEISQQRDELHAMNEQITEQRDVLEKAHEEITDSIDYASRIQHALLPSEDAMRQNADVYVYYNARDVVSGDFYWTHRIDEDAALYSAADCTGHGVPGAFMSVLGATTLDTIVREYGETRPDLMLGLLDKSIRASLKQDESKDGSLDGMDLALIKLDKKQNKLFFSSAGRPLFLLRNGEILEYKGAKFPAGGAQHGEKEFPLIEIDLKPGDRVFMCSDGITDQFGGPRGRKFSPRRLKETLLAHQDKDLQAQGAAFAAAFDDWQKNAKQLDDQLLIGLAA